MYNILGRVVAFLIRKIVRFVTGARSLWVGCEPEHKPRIYYANHRSHIDFILLWSSLPRDIRRKTHPIAASDYWDKNFIRRFLIYRVFNGIVIQRNQKQKNPLHQVEKILRRGHSVILFPEGTRNLKEDCDLLPFQSGIYHLAKNQPQVECIPVWISNLNRVMPKGAFLPLPILSIVSFGAPLKSGFEEKQEFLQDAHAQLLALNEREYQ